MTATAGPATFKLHHINQHQSASISMLLMRHMADKLHVCKKYLKPTNPLISVINHDPLILLVAGAEHFT